MGEDKEQKEDKPRLRLVIDNTPTGRIEVGEEATSARRLLGEVGKKATSGAIESRATASAEEHGQRLLDIVVQLIEKVRPQYNDDTTVEKINLLFFLLGQMAYSKQGNLAWYVLGDQEFDPISNEEGISEITRRKFARLYDAVYTFEDELIPASATKSSDMPAKYHSEVWANEEPRAAVDEGFSISRTILTQDLPSIYRMPPARLIREIKALLINKGMDIALPGKGADQLTLKRFEQEVNKLIEESWDAWRIEGHTE